LVDYQSERRNLVVLAYEQRWLIGRTLTEQIECRHPESFCH
jgi:hypothetical protein